MVKDAYRFIQLGVRKQKAPGKNVIGLISSNLIIAVRLDEQQYGFTG
jgi:hypothetical protein